MAMSISIWLKDNSKRIWVAFLSLLLLSLSFGIGYLLAKEANPAPIIIEKCSEI